MIDYETYCKIVQLHQKQLKPTQIARNLSLDLRTVLHWIEEGAYRPRKRAKRPSKLDPYKPQIVRWLEQYQYTGVQILQRLREEGYDGGRTILQNYIAAIRPKKFKAYLTLSFAPGECAQVDWGQYGSVPVGSTQRRLSFFVMVLCYSRMMYVEFTVLQSMEHFLACHQNAFNFFGAVPENIMVDNLKSAVIKRLIGQAPVFNPRYLDFANHHGFKIKACGVGKGNEKGRVENAVGYVKKNFLGGLDIPDFSSVNPTARHWMDTIANVRVHGATKKRPVDLFKVEKPAMGALPEAPYAVAVSRIVRATNRFRVNLDSNRYSVPAEYAGQRLALKAYPDRLCIYHNDQLIAQHPRSYDRNRDFEDPDHPRALLAQRRAAKEQRLLMRFLTLSPKSEAYYQQLQERRMNPRHHIRQIVALSEIYGKEKIARAIEDAFTFQAFSCEYIANILEQRAYIMPEPGALHLTRRQDLLELDMPEPDLSIYETDNHQKRTPMTRRTNTHDDKLLHEHLEYLRLTSIREHYEPEAKVAAQKQWSHVDYLARLLEGEAALRRDRSIARRIKMARFPVLKSLDEFDWSWPKNINRLQVQNLFRLSFIKEQSNVILVGGVGLGKTHLSIALGHAACLAGHSVLFASAIDIVNTLAAARKTGRVKDELKRYLRPAVLLVDELGYLPIDKTGADLLFQVISQRYERGSIILTTNRIYKEWPEIFNNDATLTSAVLDRLLHHADTVPIEGKSYRMKDRIEP